MKANDLENSSEFEEDESFDQLCRDLLAKNHSRYQEQTLELLAKGHLELNLNGFEYEYRLEKHDVSFRFAAVPETEFKEYARTYVYQGESQKLEYIPLFFAQCEATLLSD